MQSRWGSVAAVCLALAIIATPTLGRADLEAGKLKASKAAASEFSGLAKGSEKTGEAPLATDPNVKKLLDTVFDDSDITQSKSIRFEALQPLSERIMTGVQVGLVYMLAGTGATDINEASKVPDADVKVNLNTIKFAAEMGQFYDFQLHVQGAIADSVATKLATASRLEIGNAKFKATIDQIRGGAQQTISGLIETLAVNGITEEWRRDRLPALKSAASSIVKILHPEQKKQLNELARACADVMDDSVVKNGLQEVAKVFAG